MIKVPQRAELGFGCGFLLICTILAVFLGVAILDDSGDPQVITLTITFESPLPAITPQATQIPLDPSIQITQETPVLSPTPNPSQTVAATKTTLPEANLPREGKIVYTCFDGSFDQICIIQADGSGQKQITTGQSTHFYPSLSKDGNTILYAERSPQLVYEVVRFDLLADTISVLTQGIGNLFAPELSPNGENIIFTNAQGRHQTIWQMGLNGENPLPLTDSIFDDIDPTWSPDGSRIAFASSRAGGRQLFLMNSDGSGIQQVTNLPDMGGRSSWSPDGTQLTFYAGPAGARNIFSIDIESGSLQQVTTEGDNLGPSWSPDGNWIAFTSYREGNNDIYIIQSDGSGLSKITTSRRADWQPRWGP